MKKVYGYVRVSTQKQGKGVSLAEQKAAIARYAKANNLHVIEWFEELVTAGKIGRPMFTKMLGLLRKKKSEGLILHKIDRGARNLADWVEFRRLHDEGFSVHFAHESVNLNERGGRLSADMLAVVATDMIFNQSQETKKGLQGRLKQGVYPFKAPTGYMNAGRGNPLKIDKVRGPLVTRAFEIYATGKYNLKDISNIMYKMGLRNEGGNKMYVASLSKIFNNPIYMGVISIKGTTYKGAHKPLITPHLYNSVQNILNGKVSDRVQKHEFLFRKLLKCAHCEKSLIGELQKGNVYYRCHTVGCITKGVRETSILKQLTNAFSYISFYPDEIKRFEALLEQERGEWDKLQISLLSSIRLQLAQINRKLEKLTDAWLDDEIEKAQYESRKTKLYAQLKLLEQKEAELREGNNTVFGKVINFLELSKSLLEFDKMIIQAEKRDLVKIVTSNLAIDQKNLEITMAIPFFEMANRNNLSKCDLTRHQPRILKGNSLDVHIQQLLPKRTKFTDEQLSSLLNFILNRPDLFV